VRIRRKLERSRIYGSASSRRMRCGRDGRAHVARSYLLLPLVNNLRTILHTTHTRSSINDIFLAGERLVCKDGIARRSTRLPRNFVERNFYPLSNFLCRNKRPQREKSFGTASHYDCVHERDGREGKPDRQACRDR